MTITDFNSDYFTGRSWRAKVLLRAIRFSWRHPRHIQATFDLREGVLFVQINQGGWKEDGVWYVLRAVCDEAIAMSKVSEVLKANISND